MRGLSKRMPSHREIDVSMCNGILRIWLRHVAHLLISLNHRMRGLNHLIISSAHLICSSHLLISSAHLICSSHLILLLLLRLLSLSGLKTSCLGSMLQCHFVNVSRIFCERLCDHFVNFCFSPPPPTTSLSPAGWSYRYIY